ncbi:MAG: hybrid sensor histidine kinase/response regulator [Steroidobacteraceae bacterium]
MRTSANEQEIHPAGAGAERNGPARSLPASRESALEAALARALAERDHARVGLGTAVAELERTRELLCDASRREDEFLATLAHELRNPLAPIRSAAQIMRLAEDDHAASSAARAIIERQLKHLVRLIDNLVDVSRITRGKLELRKERVELATVLEIAVEINRPLLESKQQHVLIDLPREPLLIDADTTRIAQVFANLLNNSAKYSDAWTQIEIRGTRDGSHAVITVDDQGAGIEPERLERIFDLYTRTDRPAALPHDGLGVGLTLVKRLVELHGGTVSAHSEGSGRGSSFSVRLELLEASRPEGAAPPMASKAGRTALRARILVVDDNHDAAQSLALLLGMDGHEVRTAGDGLEALEVAEEFRPQVALLDIGMPKLDGYETARRLRARPWAAGMLLFALTGWGLEEDRERARQAGFDRHLVKPVDPEALTQLLSQTLLGGRTGLEH